MNEIRYYVASKLHTWADRISDRRSYRGPGLSFTFEEGKGVVVHQSRNIGCPLWYINEDHDRAHNEGGAA